ncbi:P-loop containing nucleoside triphosphate hydrolase protein [Lasiosphaeria miniovina]|uniref:RNA helicase n=1 Tax=Lasiosphaeria miniovina TaxID=1954250 RepID=A0AA40B4N0_9PEZI|nr:P-loop containing nucleoside triphosphate hydrolase protein [Lasiosphaeria miniovina]KAK0727343.1 P-loop containing nucleoside triphosphate hydrolase protein [Lasiosphaeria miniovina]
MPKTFVPRQRKRKILDRQRAQKKAAARDDQEIDPEEGDSNIVEITPAAQADAEKKRARLRDEFKPQDSKFSSKKAKRLEKYIDAKLKKDETRELLAKLAANKIDTSLFSSSKSIGQTKETKREALSRALREEHAGLALDKSKASTLLYQPRKVGQGSPEEDGPPESSSNEQDGRAGAGLAQPRHPLLLEQNTPVAVGSGLKRPLERDDSGRPILAKRQKRGTAKPKPPSTAHAAPAKSEVVEWDGFSSDNEGSSDEGSDLDSDDGELDSPSSGEGSEKDTDSGEDSDEESSGDDADPEDEATRHQRKERSSAFKAWAHQKRNEALGYQPIDSNSLILSIPKPENFTPRPLEQDPLPVELQPTTNVTRKAFSVVVTRAPDIEEARYRLPVVAEEQKIMEAIHNNDVVVICGATGSGKTTQVPQFLFEAGYGSPNSRTPGMIGVTQPRRVAAVSMSKRVGQEMGNYSHAVAYQIRFEGNVDPKTALKFMTDGVLLREAAQDIALRKYSALIIDEAHERSVNTDILIAMLSRIVKLRGDLAKEDPSVRPLKLIIMSATLRIEDLTQNPSLFSTPPRVIEVEGREHSVTLHFSRKTRHDYVKEVFQKISRGHKKLPPGGILVFLTGQGEISQLSKQLKSAFGGGLSSTVGTKVRISATDAPIEAEDIDFGDIDDRNVIDMDDEVSFESDDEEEGEFDIEDEEAGTGPMKMHVLPLYSLLPTKEQMRVFDHPPDGSRLVILATNVAETSLTIPGIRYVFDCGRSKERRFDPVSGVQSFEIGWISKASAKQRAGRAGRTGPGHCWRLYSSAVYERDFSEFSQPELLRMPLEGVVLQLKSMNLQHVVNFPFPSPPDRQSLIKAEKVLSYLSAISPSGQITRIGSTMSIFPLSPRYARILLVGHLHDCMPYTIALVAGMSAGQVFVPENQAIPAASVPTGDFRTTEDVIADDRRAKLRQAFNMVHKNFCFLDDKSDAIKLLQVVGEFAHEPTEAWCESHFVHFKILKEIRQLQSQIVDLLRTNILSFVGLKVPDKLDAPSSKQIQALKQMVAAGFIDQVAIRADKSPNPPEMCRKPRRAIDVPYLPLIPLEGEKKLEDSERLVYIHPGSPLAHLSVEECPDYVVYAYLQKVGNTGADSTKKPKTRMHALTALTGGQLASLAKGTPLITYGKPIKEIMADSTKREVWVIPYLRAENTGGLGWPLPARKVTQKKVAGKGWVVE